MLKFLIAGDVTFNNDTTTIAESFGNNIVLEYVNDEGTLCEKVKETDFDLIILEADIASTDRIRLLNNILISKPSSRILMCSKVDNDTYVRNYLQLGVMGYVINTRQETEYKKAIENLLSDKMYVSSELLETLVMTAVSSHVTK